MKLETLARTFARLETTAGRTATIRLLADLLRTAADTERAPIVYLLQGRLRPPYEGVQLGVGERVLVRVLARLSGESGAAIGRRFRRLGDQGLVAKQPDAPYAAGARKYSWIKLKRAYQQKLRDTFDLVLVGYLAGHGKRAHLGIGSLLAAVYDPRHDRFRTVAKIGSGADDRAWIELKKLLDARATSGRPRRVDSSITPDIWVEPHYVVEVLADEITRSPRHTCGATRAAAGYALRFPRILDGVRTDKGPQDATTEREVVEMFKMQRAVGTADGRRSRVIRRARR